MATAKIPAQLRLTFVEQDTYEKDEVGEFVRDSEGKATKIVLTPLAYAIAYTPTTKAYAAQKASQEDWAYGADHWHGEITQFEQDGKIWIRRKHWERIDGNHVAVFTDKIVEDYLQPKIIDNVPLEGFKILHSVYRDRGNKLWRILDPRGFELEITTGTMENLIMSGTIEKGLIVGPCIWRTGKILERV